MASGAVGRKTTSHSYSSTSAGNLDNNLDALLDDLQTSISTKSPAAPKHSARQERIIETTSSRHSPLRSQSPMRSVSPSGARTTTVEKFVSTGPAGTSSGIPGLEMLDKELQDVQPGQSKTVAYKQVSYHYDKQQEGQNLEPWIKSSRLTKNDASIVDDFCERTFEKSSSSSSRALRDTTDFAKNDKEIIYKADVSTKTIPAPVTTTTDMRSTERDFKYMKETSSYTEPSPVSPRKLIKTVRTDETEDLTNVEYIPASSPIPASLAPGPNTKVTKTVKTYTYELPGGPEPAYPATSSSSSLSRNVQLEKATSSYASLPRDAGEKSVSYRVEEQRSGYVPPSPGTSRVHREEKVYVDRRIYRAASPPPPPPPALSTTSSSTISRSERYVQQARPEPDYPAGSLSRTTTEQRVLYQPEAPPPGQRTTVKQYEEHYSASRPPQPRPYYQPEASSQHTSTTVYKYDEQSLLPRPFPTSERPASPRQQPPKRIEDLMASFSDSEEVVELRHERKSTKESSLKKEVDFIPHSPSVVKSKNVAGPPVYYPPGSAEFSRKEESMGAMSKASGGWAKEKAAWEYGASGKMEEKVKTKKAVVPVCLPLCCALPCVIM